MSFEPSQHVGETVTVRGTAYVARAGAIVELDDRTPIYIAGMEEWDDKVNGKGVEVTGLLQERPAKAPKVAAGAPQVHGLTGATFVLENAKWTVLA